MRFLPENFLSWNSLYASLRTAATFALRSVVPSLLFLFAPLFFFPRGGFAVGVWVILLLLWLAVWGVAESVRTASREYWQMQLRQVLASFRALCNDATTRILQAQAQSLPAPQALAAGFDHDTLMSEIMGAVFYVVSENNRDLEQHFRVTFMEVVDDALWIKYYKNTDNEPPATMLAGECFKLNEGVAGRAWSQNAIVIDADTEHSQIFAPKTQAHREFEIKSLVSIPVDIWEAAGKGRTVVGVLNIDSDQKNYFRSTHSHRRQIEITIRPYVRLIRLLYAAHQSLAVQPP